MKILFIAWARSRSKHEISEKDFVDYINKTIWNKKYATQSNKLPENLTEENDGKVESQDLTSTVTQYSTSKTYYTPPDDDMDLNLSTDICVDNSMANKINDPQCNPRPKNIIIRSNEKVEMKNTGSVETQSLNSVPKHAVVSKDYVRAPELTVEYFENNLLREQEPTGIQNYPIIGEKCQLNVSTENIVQQSMSVLMDNNYQYFYEKDQVYFNF